MNLDYYRRQGVMYFNGRPVNKMGKPGTLGWRILRMLGTGKTTDELTESLGQSREIVYQTLYRLRVRGMVEQSGGKWIRAEAQNSFVAEAMK